MSDNVGTALWDQKFEFDRNDHIGKGSYGQVCLGVLIETGEQIAVKCSDLSHSKAAQNEYNTLLKFTKSGAQHIVKLLGVKCESGKPVAIALERAKCSLDDLIMKTKEHICGLNQLVMTDLINDTYNGAVSLCEHSIAHRDIKPANILVFIGPTPSANNKRRSPYLFKFCDVGNAKQHDDRSMNSMVGTPAFLHPTVAQEYASNNKAKQVSQKYTALQSDFWALASTLYIAATAQMPFPTNDNVYAKTAKSILDEGNSQHIAVEVSNESSEQFQYRSTLPDSNCSKWFAHCVAVLIRMMMHKPDMNSFKHIAEALRDSSEYTFYSLTNLEIVKYCDLSQDKQLGGGYPALLPQIVFDDYEGDITFISKKTGAVITCKAADMDITLLDSNNTYVVFPKNPKFPAKTWIDKPLTERKIDTDLMKLMYHRKGIALGVRALRDCKDFILITKNSAKTLNRFIDALFKSINELLNKIELISTINAYSGSQCQALCLLTSGDNKKLGMAGNSNSVRYGDELGCYQGKIGEVQNRLREILFETENLQLTNVDDLSALQEELNGNIKQSGDVKIESYRKYRSNHLVQICLTKRLQLIDQMRGSNTANTSEVPLVKSLFLLINELLSKQSVIEDIEKKVSECSKLVQMPLEEIRTRVEQLMTEQNIDPRDLNRLQFNMSQYARLSDRSREIRELVSRLGNLIPDVEEN